MEKPLSRRSAHDIRVDFKIMTVTAQASAGFRDGRHFERLWDEANTAAAALLSSLAVRDYLALLKEMHRWCREQQLPTRQVVLQNSGR